jgi:hypothetical protein
MSGNLVNKVAQSGLITLDLETFFPTEEIIAFDIKEFLFRGLILKEIDFRAALKEHDWSQYNDKTVAVFCSADAILPQWSFMLITTYLMQHTNKIYVGTKEQVEQDLLLKNINEIDGTKYIDGKLVIKGCGTKTVNSNAYLEITKKLQPYVKSLMFGEPCSTVPVYKKK